MYKVVWLLKRKKGMTHDEFREHFETVHARLAHKYLGHLFVEYRRNYATQAWFGGNPRQPDSGFAPGEWGWDVISEWSLHDEAAFNELNRLMADPVVGKAFSDDEANFLDRDSIVMIPCEMVDTGTGDGHATLALQGKPGQAN